MSIAELTKENNRLKIKLAIEQDRVSGLRETVAYYRDAYRDEVIRNLGLTSPASNVKLTANKEDR